MGLLSRLAQLFHPAPAASSVAGRTVRVIVDNRRFLMGLDELYREAMKAFEVRELLPAARAVAARLGVVAADVPVEGYYLESPELREYFMLVRALQAVPLEREAEVARVAAFRRLLEVASSPVFGPPVREYLLPKGKDPLSAALLLGLPWTVPVLLERAGAAARAGDDYSLVGLAARAADPVMLAALRESVVLYAMDVTLGSMPAALPEYVWAVDPEIAAAAARFVAAFNRLVGASLPKPVPAQARAFALAASNAHVVGRCVRLGQDGSPPARFYHWAVVESADGSLGVREFWDTRVWTTSDYRQGGAPRSAPPPAPPWRPGIDASPGRITRDFRGS